MQENSDDFQMFFPSEQCRLTFFRLVQELTADQKGTVMDLEAEILSGPIQVSRHWLQVRVQAGIRS